MRSTWAVHGRTKQDGEFNTSEFKEQAASHDSYRSVGCRPLKLNASVTLTHRRWLPDSDDLQPWHHSSTRYVPRMDHAHAGTHPISHMLLRPSSSRPRLHGRRNLSLSLSLPRSPMVTTASGRPEPTHSSAARSGASACLALPDLDAWCCREPLMSIFGPRSGPFTLST